MSKSDKSAVITSLPLPHDSLVNNKMIRHTLARSETTGTALATLVNVCPQGLAQVTGLPARLKELEQYHCFVEHARKHFSRQS